MPRLFSSPVLCGLVFAALAAGAVAPAQAGVSWSIGIQAPIAPGVTLGTVISDGHPGRVAAPVYAPEPVYLPAPVYRPVPVYVPPPPVYAPPVVYAPAPVYLPAPVYAPRRVVMAAPVWAPGWRHHGEREHWRHEGWREGEWQREHRR